MNFHEFSKIKEEVTSADIAQVDSRLDDPAKKVKKKKSKKLIRQKKS